MLPYYISIYILIFLMAIGAFYLTSKFLKNYFKIQVYKAKSLSHPIIKGITVLVTIFSIRHYFAVPIINYFIQLLNNNLHLNAPLLDQQSAETGTVEAIILYLTVAIIIIVYIVFAYTRKTINATMNNDLKEKPITKIIFPVEKDITNPIFHERVQRLFELKYEKENLQLSYDKEYSLLYGIYEFGLHKYCKIIYCKNSINRINISKEDVTAVYNSVKQLPQKYNLDSDKIQLYYILENGKIDINQLEEMQCFTEDSFLNHLINFNKYLEKLINKFNNDKLPFSSADNEEEKFTLGQTFIQPRYTINKHIKEGELGKYIDTWLSQSNKKHLVILGDYGMGKSTFMKYYAATLAASILYVDNIIRFPVFISLTNNSPRHGGIENSIGKFISDNLGVKRELFDILVDRGKIVFLLDGFDEMGYVGTHDQRIKQLNAIWQLATKNNKIIISGRPSYFPTEQELVESFNILDINEQLTPQEKPYCERIELDGFDEKQIEESISLYNFKKEEKIQYIDFIKSNTSILDLCKRPSMMHIIREMLPKLYSQHETEKLSASNLMSQYLDHWITRQLEKDIISSIEDKNKKKKFVRSFFSQLACDFYLKGVEKQTSEEILKLLGSKMDSLNLKDANEIEGFETEILSGYFIEIEDGEYRFVHKSFKEFLIADQIIKHINQKKFTHPLIISTIWSQEINDFVFKKFYPNKINGFIGEHKIPYLLDLTPFSEVKKINLLKHYKNREYLYDKILMENYTIKKNADFLLFFTILIYTPQLIVLMLTDVIYFNSFKYPGFESHYQNVYIRAKKSSKSILDFVRLSIYCARRVNNNIIDSAPPIKPIPETNSVPAESPV